MKLSKCVHVFMQILPHLHEQHFRQLVIRNIVLTQATSWERFMMLSSIFSTLLTSSPLTAVVSHLYAKLVWALIGCNRCIQHVFSLEQSVWQIYFGDYVNGVQTMSSTATPVWLKETRIFLFLLSPRRKNGAKKSLNLLNKRKQRQFSGYTHSFLNLK